MSLRRCAGLSVLLGCAGVLCSVSGGCSLESAYWSPRLSEFATPDGYRDVRVDVGGDEWVQGWFVPAPSLAAGRVARAPLLIFCHGRASSIDQLTPYVLPAAQEADASLLVFAYRGFGRSSPKENLTRASVVADTSAVVRSAFAMPGVDPSSVFLMGYSLGVVPALAVAAQEPKVAGVVVGGGYARASDALADNGRGWAAWLIGGAFDPVDSAREMSGRPVYIFHGDVDTSVSVYHAYALAEAAARAGAAVKLDVVPEGGHYSVITSGRPLMERIGTWLKAHVARAKEIESSVAK